jgi:hypothetical protein
MDRLEDVTVGKVLFGALGLLAWLGAQWIALGIIAGGHGLIAPLSLSMPLLFLYPIAFIRAFCVTTGRIGFDQGLLAIAGLLDVLLLSSTFAEEKYFWHIWSYPENRPVLAEWMALWAGWQLLVLASLIKNRRPEIDAERS